MSKFESDTKNVKEYENGIILSFFGDSPSLPYLSFDKEKDEDLFGDLLIGFLTARGCDFLEAIISRYRCFNSLEAEVLESYCLGLKKAIDMGTVLKEEELEDRMLDEISNCFSNKEKARIFFEKAFLYYYEKNPLYQNSVTDPHIAYIPKGRGEKSSSVTNLRSGYEGEYRT